MKEKYMKKCCEETTRYLTRIFNLKEWQDAKENMIRKYGKVLSIIEIKELAKKEGVTFREMQAKLGLDKLL